MRHWAPWIKETVAQMAADGIERAVVICMAPHYSTLSIGAYRKRLDETAQAECRVDVVGRIAEAGDHRHLRTRPRQRTGKRREACRNAILEAGAHQHGASFNLAIRQGSGSHHHFPPAPVSSSAWVATASAVIPKCL